MLDNHSTLSEAKALIIQTTTPTIELAKLIAEKLVRESLAACVNLSAPSLSIYSWKDTLHRSKDKLHRSKTLQMLQLAKALKDKLQWSKWPHMLSKLTTPSQMLIHNRTIVLQRLNM